MTNREALVKFFKIFHKCREVESSSRKYIKLETPKGKIYWIGKSGAIRTGSVVSKSVSLTGFYNVDKVKELLDKEVVKRM